MSSGLARVGEQVAEGLGLAWPEHVAIVGAGGKTTVLLGLWHHLHQLGRPVLATTTTKVAVAEVAGLVFLSSRPEGHKLVGIPPATADEVFRSGAYDAVLVEADGARHQLVKAPGPHEPVIPHTATFVVAVIGAGALDRVIEDVAFRPLRVAAAAGCSPYDRLSPALAARLLTSDLGARRGVPPGARFGVVIARVSPDNRAAAESLAALLHGTGVTAVLLPAVDAGDR